MDRTQIFRSLYRQSPEEKIAQVIKEGTGYTVSPLAIKELPSSIGKVFACMAEGRLLFIVLQSKDGTCTIKRFTI